jgi:hypothetical protein
MLPLIEAAHHAVNGFEALKFWLGDGIHLADRLDATADIWPALLLWTDRNHNGISEPDELVRVADSGIISIALDYRRSKRQRATAGLNRSFGLADGRPVDDTRGM